jgi:hypothetical protein
MDSSAELVYIAAGSAMGGGWEEKSEAEEGKSGANEGQSRAEEGRSVGGRKSGMTGILGEKGPTIEALQSAYDQD